MYCITIQKIFYSLLHVFFLPFLSRLLWMHKHKIKTKVRMISRNEQCCITFESSCERFITFLNDAELAILSILCYTIGQCIVVMDTKYLHVQINNLSL